MIATCAKALSVLITGMALTKALVMKRYDTIDSTFGCFLLFVCLLLISHHLSHDKAPIL